MNQKGALKAGTDMLLSGGDVHNREKIQGESTAMLLVSVLPHLIIWKKMAWRRRWPVRKRSGTRQH
ncbi:hypothetical protein ACLB1N_21030 [Escherichia coli]